MKRLVLAVVLLLPLSVSAEEFPQRKAGLWEVEMSMKGLPGTVMKQCVDEQTDAKMMNSAKDLMQQGEVSCSEPEMKQSGSTYSVKFVCSMGEVRMTSETTYQGDFDKSYQGTTKTSFDPPMMGMSEQVTNISARWTGPCEKGMAPGDTILPGGRKVKLDS